ncbi:MAG: hypothetical protein AB8I08_31950 [Sandaracinaceae bacterium]
MASPSASRASFDRGAVAIAAGAVVLLGLRAWARVAMYDHHEVDLSPFDAGWMLQAPFRATLGEWVGRDWLVPRGPLWQALSYVATGFGRLPWQWTAAAHELAFSLPAIGLGVACTRRLPTSRHRALATAILALLVLWEPVDSLRWMLTLAAALTFALPGKPEARAGAVSAGLATVALMLSFERGIMAFASLGLMALASLALSWRRAPVRDELPRIGGLVAGAIVGQVCILLGFAAAGASYPVYLRDLTVLSRAYTVAMRLGDGAQHAPLLGLGVCLGLGALLVGRSDRAARQDATLLLGAAPTLVAGLVRNDPPHIFMGASVAIGALTWVALRLASRDERSRAGAAAMVVGVALLGLLPTHSAPLRDWLALPTLARGAERDRLAARHRDYQGDVRHVAGWLMHRRRQGEARCVALDESLAASHAIAEVGGPVALRWNPTLQSTRASRIAAADCPHYVHRFFTQDSELRWASWVFGEDFLEVARRYRPTRRLGPAVTVMAARPSPRPLESAPIGAESLGEWRTVPPRGALRWRFDRAVPEDALVRITFEVGASRSARLFDAIPLPEIAFLNEDDAETLRQPAPLMHAAGRGTLLMAPDPWVVERRWIDGTAPDVLGSVRSLQVTRSEESDPVTPLRIRLVSLEELRPPDRPPMPRPGATRMEDDLLRPGRLVGRFALPRRQPDGLRLEPHPETRLEASVQAQLVPAMGDRLVGSLRLDARSDGARIRLEVQHDAAGRGSRKVVLLEQALSPGASTALDLPLDPWVGERIWLRLVVLDEGEARFDGVQVYWLRVVPGSGPATLAAALRTGGTAPVTGYGDVFLHPEGPDEPPVEVRVPMRGGGCFATGLEHAGGEGDGAWMEGIVETVADPRETEVLFRAHLAPGDRRTLPPMPLPSRDFELVLRVRPGLTNSFDWTRFVLPRRVACPLSAEESGDLLAAFAAGTGRALHGQPSWDDGALFLHPNAPATPPAELRFEVSPEQAMCVTLDVEHRGEAGDGASVLVRIQDGAEEREVGQVQVDPGERETLTPTSIPALRSPRGELILRSVPGETSEADWLYLLRAEMRPCPET